MTHRWWSLWRVVALCVILYSLSRISLGITYCFIPKAQLPPALQDFGILPIQFWGAAWGIEGLLCIWAAVTLFRGWSSMAALIAAVFMHTVWTMAYTFSWVSGESFDTSASSGSAGFSALIVALGLVIATLRRRYTPPGTADA